MSVFLGAIDKKEKGYKSVRELKADMKRLILAPKSLNIFESLPNSIINKTVKVKLPDLEKPFKTKVVAEYANMFKGSGKYSKLYPKEFIIEILK
jgi:hypothetical protein